MFRFGQPRPRRAISLTPMIDVVFLLLVFFMLVGRFGLDRPLELSLASGALPDDGPPRLVDVSGNALRLNGATVGPEQLILGLETLTSGRADLVVLRVSDNVGVQRLVNVMSLLDASGFTRVSVIGAVR